MELEFIGGIFDVTGSMTLLKTRKGKILVDSGLYQGIDEVVKRNRNPLPFDPKDVDAIILTHAHLDHCGFIPRLVMLGFRGTIFCTKQTMKLSRLIMLDSAKIMMNEKHLLHGFYTVEDVSIVTSLFKVKKFHEVFELLGMNVELIPAGHILGAASVVISGEKKIVFSGDLGRINDPLIEHKELCPDADVVVMESTYGGTVRKGNSLENDLENFLKLVKKESKVGIIASFAVSRAQLLITLIYNYYLEYPKEKIRLVIDGPMMVAANNIYKEFSEDTKMGPMLKAALAEVEVIDQEGEWESLRKKDGPLIVITSSGMVSGGRIWRYLENWQQDSNACLFLPGYQGEGTSGKLLSEGKRIIHDEDGKKIHWHGSVITSKAFSSHSDQNELVGWLKNVAKERTIYLNHGEPDSKKHLKDKLVDLGYKAVKVANCEKYQLIPDGSNR